MADILYGFDPSTIVTDTAGNMFAGRVGTLYSTYVGGTPFTATKAVVGATLTAGAASGGLVTTDAKGRAGFFTTDYFATLFLDFGDGTRWPVNPTKHAEAFAAALATGLGTVVTDVANREQIPVAAERIYYVTPRGNDTNDGLTLASAKLTIAGALTALGALAGVIQLGVGSYSTSTSHGLRSGQAIIGCGPNLTTVTYTGTGSLFTTATPGVRSYNQQIKDLAMVGPGKASTAIAIDVLDMSNAIIDGVNLNSFGTGIKNSSVVLGGAVYTHVLRSVINTCTKGADIQPDGSNSSRWHGVKFGNCDIAVNIFDSNQNGFVSCQFEVNVVAVFIDGTLAGLVDHNVFSACRFENNATAWTVNSAVVRNTVMQFPGIFGAYTFVDNGTNTQRLENHGSLPPLGTRRRTITRVGSYTIPDGDDVVFFNAVGATATLPSAVTAGNGRQFLIKNRHASSPLTVVAAAGTIDGATTLLAKQSAVYISNGTDWYTWVAPAAVAAAVTDWTLPTAALAQTFPRNSPSASSAIIASGTLLLVGIQLTAGQTVSSITFCSSSTAMVTPANQWFSLYSSARALLGVTSDDTATAWGTEAVKTLTLAVPYVVPTTGLYYVGIVVVAATMPSLRCATTGSRITTQLPILVANSSTGLTTPGTAPATAAALAAAVAVPYAFVS